MDHTSGAKPLVTVSLTVEDEWQSDPLRVVAGIREGKAALDGWQRKAVEAARAQGRTWDEIGRACGVSRQAAWERFAADD